MKLRKGDTVKVLAGNDKGKTGEVLQVIPKNKTVVVKDVNVKKKATKPRKAGETGGIISKEFPIDVSKLELVCPKCNKPTRVGIKIVDGKKVRVCKKCGAELTTKTK